MPGDSLRVRPGAVRPPAVAGRFYPGDPAALDREVSSLLARAGRTPRRHLGVMAPHAGYVYSGATAAAAFADTEVPRRTVVLAPNHTGRGARGAVWAEGALAIPGGEVPVDEPLCARLLARAPLLEDDRRAHAAEHALEVELPFLRARRPDVTVTPIILGGFELDELCEIGEALARAIRDSDEPVLVVASSDLNHYLPDAETRAIDRRAIDALLTLDPATLWRTVHDEEISMCGVAPATAMLACARALGAARAELLAYATSGDAFGDRSRVVGYAAVTVDAA